MTFLQFGIGTVNDVVDAPRDAGRKAGKPLPAGLVTVRAAMIAAASLFGAGFLLALSVSALSAALAIIVIAIGLAYDLRLKGTAWSWLPFAVGIPILPVFGWLGATGTLAPAFAFLVPAAVAAGAGLAIGNALVDVERDRAAGASSIAAALGPTLSASVATALFGVVWVAAVATALAAGRAIVPVAALVVAGFVPVAAGWLSVRASSARRERLWQLEAIGLACLAAIWIGVMVGNPAGR